MLADLQDRRRLAHRELLIMHQDNRGLLAFGQRGKRPSDRTAGIDACVGRGGRIDVCELSDVFERLGRARRASICSWK